MGAPFLVLAILTALSGASAPTQIRPPDPKSALSPSGPLADSEILELLAQPHAAHVFDAFEGQNASKRAQASKSNGLFVADGFPVDFSSSELFESPFATNGANAFVASITSLDAFALRLRVDLSLLGPSDEVFVIDPALPRAFGPYTNADHVDGGKWLATTPGDTCVLLVRTPEIEPPLFSLVSVSHFYEDLDRQLKELSCNNDIACETDNALEESATGVGMMIVPQGDFFQALCSGALINNADTAAFEPYFLTSWHCVPDIVDANQVEILWDWRDETCNGNDSPSISSLPRSDGERLLRTSSTYDITLMELDTVPSGDFGRAYLGWETRDPIDEEDVVTIHFPVGSPMKISYGNVKEIDQNSNGFTRQTKVHWEDGVTEGGSSGGPLLLAEDDYRICGTLSNGPAHSCLSTGGNVDWYSSFRDFFPSIEDYLTGDTPPVVTPDPPVTCAAEKAFPGNTTVLDALRAFRDNGLKQSSLGESVVKLYYDTAPATARAVEQSSLLRWTVRAVAVPVALASRMLWDE
ncbi:MAG TPA: serine protease [Candidatus Hydrogenedentes bacterium]|nr:serine protease [Candidatus Hydrogenedentota bacterium]HRK33236.1 serine protease [Candidatus Hydrogenedentota bacterium]